MLLNDLDDAYWTALAARFRVPGRAAILGIPMGDPLHGYTNSALGLSVAATGMPGGYYRYDKHHLVPFGEFVPDGFHWFTRMMNIPLGDFNRGPLTAPSFDVDGERIAPNICYEDLFGEELAARFVPAREAPTILANLSNIGWFGKTIAIEQHLRISRMRSLELQRPMIRATNTGATAVIDHHGVVTHALPPFSVGILEGDGRGAARADAVRRVGRALRPLAAVGDRPGRRRRRRRCGRGPTPKIVRSAPRHSPPLPSTTDTPGAMLSFQQIILRLQSYWAERGCALLQPYDMEVGAGTSHTATFLRALGPEPWKAAYVQPSRRPKDGRYGENPNRLQHYYQYQVVLKPAPADILDLYLGSLEALGFDLTTNDVRFVEDDWENPTLGAWGLGWEVWLNGMEVTQFTYFQQVGGIDCKPITGEITYGLERLAMYLQGVDNVYKLQWTDGLTYGDVYHQNEVEQSTYNFEKSDVEFLLAAFAAHERPGDGADGRVAGAARLRAGAQGRAQLQPARRARRDQRHRARRLHRPHPHAGAQRRPELPREPRAARLPDGAEGVGRRGRAQLAAKTARRRRAAAGVMATVPPRPLLVELFVEELPPKALPKLAAGVRRWARRRLAAAESCSRRASRSRRTRRRAGSPC